MFGGYMQKLTIKIKYHSADIPEITPIDQGDCIDLYAAERVELKAFESAVISLGISVKLPDGYKAQLTPRSSTFKRWGIIQTNSVGTIDNSYCGENDIWGMPVLAMRDTVIEIGDKICQFEIVKKMEKPDIIKVDHMEDADRGGFGSTGSR